MSPAQPRQDAVPHSQLGALVRERRERLGLSMAQLAEQSRVSRSSIHRLEHSHEVRPTPSKLARVLAVVGLGEDDVRDTMPDDAYRTDLLHWMATAPPEPLAGMVDGRREPELVAIHPSGAVAQVQIQGDDDGTHTEALADAIKRAGWLVARPA